METKTILVAIFLAVLWFFEGCAPFYSQFRDGVRSRLVHGGKNLIWGVGNSLLLSILVTGMLVGVESWSASQNLGLLRSVTWPFWSECLVAFVLFDLWMYIWHRANHEMSFLWRFHRMHHSDPEMDVTTAVRFHFGEIAFSTIARLFVLVFLGMELWQLAVYELVLLPVILFHHANVSLPRWLDDGLRSFIVTPAMHRVHHSCWQPETDSNYGSVFPYWDMLFRTMRLRRDAHNIQLGLAELDDNSQSLWGMMKTPLARLKERSTAEGTCRNDPGNVNAESPVKSDA